MNCALITGASRGIGREIALRLAIDHQLHILINYSSSTEEAKNTLDEIKANGGSGELLRFSVEKKEEVDTSLNEWNKQNPEKFISVLINNASINDDSLFMWMNESSWNNVLDITLNGFYNVTNHVIKKMLFNKQGRIINVSSLSGVRGSAGQVNYSAAKAGLIGATKSLAQEVGRMNITVNAVAPGFIETNMTKDLDLRTYLKVIPLGRIGKPSEVAHVVSFLASEKASYITGEVININGGLYT